MLCGPDDPRDPAASRIPQRHRGTPTPGPGSQHALTADLVTALYDELMLGRPVGWALKAVHVRSGAEAAALDDARKDVLEGRAQSDAALAPRLRFLDRRALVVLGDPAVALPSTAGAPLPNPAPNA